MRHLDPVSVYHDERKEQRNRVIIPDPKELTVKTCTLYGYSKENLVSFDITFAIGDRENITSYFYIDDSHIKRIIFSDDGRLRHKFLQKGSYTTGISLTKYAIDSLVFEGATMTPEKYWYDKDKGTFVGKYQYSYKH